MCSCVSVLLVAVIPSQNCSRPHDKRQENYLCVEDVDRRSTQVSVGVVLDNSLEARTRFEMHVCLSVRLFAQVVIAVVPLKAITASACERRAC